MSDADVLAAIVSTGGRLVASFELDADGRTVGARMPVGEKHYSRCSRCGERGHSIKRCNGKGEKPKPTYQEARRRR